MKNYIFLIYLLILSSEISIAKERPDFLKYTSDHWVDSIMNKLTIDQKIGQLFMIQAYSNKKNQKTEELINLINQFQVGGIIFMQGGPLAQAKISNELQQASNVPLLVAIDAETGLGFRLDSTLSYPVQMALGAIANDTLIYRMGFEIGEQCRLLGIHMNMAPVCDINVNADNPVINYRSFGEDRMQVARKSWLYALGMQDAGVLATAKHFPGHGDTQTDSHYDLPILSQSKDQLDSLELFPFNYLIDKGIGAVMTGHLQVPSLEPDNKIPATLSNRIIQKILKKDLDFNGLVITDAMNMKGVSNQYSSAESSVKALKAGNDMVEMMPRLDRAIEAVKKAVKSGDLTVEEIDEKCRKILAVKRWLGLDKQKFVKTENLYQNLNENRYQLTKRLLQEQSLTVLVNRQNTIPIQQLDTLKIAGLVIGSDQVSSFQKMLSNYTSVDYFNVSKTPSEEEIKSLLNQLNPYNLVIIGLNGMGMYPSKRFGITDQQISLIKKLNDKNTVICFFGNPYALSNFPTIQNTKSLIVTYQDDQDAQELAAQLIFGAISANGKLPVSVKDQFPINSGIEVNSIKRLKYTLPEEVNISTTYLNWKIDSLAEIGINGKAFPGCQVLIAKEGKVIFSKSYGFFTYDKIQPVKNEDLYDIASVTKITASLPAVMKLYDDKKINLNNPFADYFTEFKNTNKSEMTVRDILTHQAQLQSSIPFWLEPGSASKLRSGIFRNQPAEKYQVRISSGTYERNDFKNQIVKDIIKSPLWAHKEYHYSDLGFSLFPFVTERLTSSSFQSYLNKEFYQPLGAVSIGFKPYERYPIQQIVPTEHDVTFRKELLQGYVHDELAAMLGGVSGNAGLFSTANDLAKVMQMYLQLGYYGGKQYISSSTISEFTKVQFPLSSNRRALGFDKPNPGIPGTKNKFPAADASPESYGHTGFTGIFTWADPENQLLFIFLSNRVYPSRRNSAIYDLNIRTKMHQAVYDAIKKGLN
ncbi:MAG: glycoside hydrolase family 3 N-terminal domain-containing protein [Bacteroidota bacterium]|nr:glycoside hydrolase family 3 N-terminal domain-containing protein [Bacteroidota bacterium]